jgi:hypothetical protein
MVSLLDSNYNSEILQILCSPLKNVAKVIENLVATLKQA